ncbi:MAG: ribonuclease III [Legionellales bacterium]|nr:ribonuclease III [Legionellales bacterium]
MNKYSQWFSVIGYEFNNIELLKLALTHKSYSKNNNERLEFLGDIVLSFIISDILFKLPNNFNEGELSSCRAHLVQGETLQELAQELDIGKYLLVGLAEKKNKIRPGSSIYINAIEAIIGAIYLDSDINVCKTVVTKWYKNRIHEICPEYIKNPKTKLQEFAQAKSYSLPIYSLIKIHGDEHEQLFEISCKIPELNESSIGKGSSKRKAEQNAAHELLQIIKYE